MDHLLHEFTKAYTDALVFAECEDNEEIPQQSFALFSCHALEDIKADCRVFYNRNKALILTQATIQNWSESDAMRQAGHDFLLTRNGHGCGFWESETWGNGYVNTRLTEHAETFGAVHPYMNEKNEINLEY